jgi:hypothetical protein
MVLLGATLHGALRLDLLVCSRTLITVHKIGLGTDE